jgi:hypothetical protein
MVKQGDRVIVDGREATVETSWGAGAHRVFKLSDGREVLDLTDVSLAKVEEPKATRKWDWLPEDGKHDLEE